MASIKSTSGVLGNLVNLINSTMAPPPSNSFSNPVSMDDDSIPAGLLDVEPVFEINYKSTKKQCMKKALEQIKIMVKEVVPTIMQNSDMILDKIKQDGEQLGNLYYEYAKSDVMLLALMETVSRGDTLARLFEVYTKMTDLQLKLSSKITETQNLMRKYYIDTYLDLLQKDQLNEAIGVTNNQTPAITGPAQQTITDNRSEKNENVIVGTENVVKMLQERKQKAMMAKYQEVKD